ncbi:hypothetical protein J4G07_00260 [Candidatus Poribacteria bacterium]|nr:hypothetical protein [Candidatus Poribacteria bacterium]
MPNRNESEPLIQYAKEFLTLQVRFAQKIAEVSHQALKDVLMDHTILPVLFNLRLSDDIPNPLWDAFIEGLCMSDNPEDWTYDFYLQRIAVEPDPSDKRQVFGCFSYIYPWRNTKKLRIHFDNRETSEYGVLSEERMTLRKSELSTMFRYIQANHPDVEMVRGGSWLYNIPVYLRLFPPDYVKTAKPSGYKTEVWGLWGQFIAHKGSIRQPAATQFLECLNKQKTVEDCLQCFPYQVLTPECPIEKFYNFYNL